MDFISVAYNLVTFVVICVITLALYYKWSFGYWRRRGLQHLEPSIPFGNISRLATSKCSIPEQLAEFYHQLKKLGLKHGGVYMCSRPLYIPVDPSIIKDILQKDFSHFVDRGFYVNEELDPLTGHLFSLGGTKWRNLRTKLTTTFTSGKMRMMFDTMANCAKDLSDFVDKASLTREPVDVHEIVARFSTDTITSCAFGFECNSIRNPDAPMRYYGKRIVENTVWENLKMIAQFMLEPKLLNAINFKITKDDVEAFMLDVVKNAVDYREKNNVYRKDFLHLLIQLKNMGEVTDDGNISTNNNESKEVGLTVTEITAQVLAFFIGGFETSAATMTFALYELSINQKIQNKLRAEIISVLQRHNNEVTYEAIMEMTYLDQVINESLRKYPPLAFLTRTCTKAYHVPNTKVHIEEGTMTFIPILGLHHDPDYYPDPSKFDPDRFLEANKNKRPNFTWLPFGEGPRICIGLRFGMLQSKLGLVSVLKDCKVSLNEKTHETLTMNPKSITITSKSPIWLDVSKVQQAQD